MFYQKSLIQVLGREGEGFSGSKIKSHLKLCIFFTFYNYRPNRNRGSTNIPQIDTNSKFYDDYTTINSQNCGVVVLDFWVCMKLREISGSPWNIYVPHSRHRHTVEVARCQTEKGRCLAGIAHFVSLYILFLKVEISIFLLSLWCSKIDGVCGWNID